MEQQSAWLIGILLLVFSVAQIHPVSAQNLGQQVVQYESGFFGQYQPSTALDMVRELPGFILNDGDSLRGFGSAAGNILINGRRPSAKNDSPSSILARIPAGQIEHIELIRGQVRGIDMLGHSTLANIVLQGDLPAILRWDGSYRFDSTGPEKPSIDLSYAHHWRGIDYNFGLYLEKEANGQIGARRLYDADGVLTESTYLTQSSDGTDVIPALSASIWVGETLINANLRALYDTRKPIFTLDITPQIPGSEPRREYLKDDLVQQNIEVGLDAMRILSPDLVGKAIGLFFYQELPKTSSRRILNSSGVMTSFRKAETESDRMEGIARLELNWLGFPNHNVQLNLEGAYNSLEGSLIQTDNTGSGPVLIPVAGSNTKVDEVRADFILKDIWSFGNFELDYGLGTEVSTISQTGDAEQKRTFFFIKPQATLIYTPDSVQFVRFRVEREISQLNFNDFISSTVFDDDDVALGNPDLRPDATLITELSYERRFGRISMLRLTGFYHWIDDVLDLLPLTDTNAVPGNIGDGRRWGIEFESTIPMDWLSLRGSRMSFTARWQDSVVVDPVTGIKRLLSAQGGALAYRSLSNSNGNNRYFLRLNYRQDFQQERVSWGWMVTERNERPLFKVNELDVYDEGYAVDSFIETTRWLGLKFRVQGENLLSFNETRVRTVFAGRRNLSPISFIEERDNYNGRRITISLSGSF